MCARMTSMVCLCSCTCVVLQFVQHAQINMDAHMLTPGLLYAQRSTPTTYTQTANNGTSAPVYYISPFLHMARLTGLTPSTRYFYVVTNPANSAPA